MLDMVEIGMGRTARRTYELADINIVPSRRTRSSQDVSTAWQLDAYRFEIPVVAHPTDALVSPEFAIELGRLGGLGVLNGEGLIGRHADVEAKIAQVLEAADKEPEPSAAIRLLQQLHSAPLDPDLLSAAVARVRDAGVTTAVRVSPQNAQALTPALVAAGLDLLIIQGTIILLVGGELVVRWLVARAKRERGEPLLPGGPAPPGAVSPDAGGASL